MAGRPGPGMPALRRRVSRGKTPVPPADPDPESQPVSAQFFLQQCLIGLTNGALVALVALGYTMVYGIIGLINFALVALYSLTTP